MDTIQLDEQLTSVQQLIMVSGTFDVPAALRLRDAILRAPTHVSVMVDFTQAHRIHDFALGALLQALSSVKHSVRARGLLQHHRTVLRYLGSDPDVLHTLTPDTRASA